MVSVHRHHLSGPQILNASGAALGNNVSHTTGQGMATGDSESLGDGTNGDFNEMAFSIEKVTVTAKSRALKS